MSNDKMTRKRPLLLWFAPLGLVIVAASLIALARGIGIATAGEAMHCLFVKDNEFTAIYDAATNKQLRLTKTITIPQAWGDSSPDGNYRVFNQAVNEKGLWRQQYFVKSKDGKVVMLPSNIIIVNTLPFWSRDKRHFALGVKLATGSPENAAILIADKDGRNSQISALNIADIRWFGWSPDNAYLYTLSSDAQQLAELIRTDGSWERHKLPHSIYVGNIRVINWSPNGHKLAYSWGDPEKLSIYDPDTNREQDVPLSNNSNKLFNVQWSPYTDYLMVSEAAGLASSKKLFLYNLFAPEPLTGQLIGEFFTPDLAWWTPDGKAIVFVRNDSGTLVAYYPQNQSYKTLIGDSVIEGEVAPDGQKLMVISKAANLYNLDVLYSSEKPAVHLLDKVDDLIYRHWLPDSSAIFIAFKRGEQINLATINSRDAEQHLILQNLKYTPFFDYAAFTNDQDRFQIWWSANNVTNFAVYDWKDQYLSTYNANVAEDAMRGGDRRYFAPDKHYALLELDASNQATTGVRHDIAMVWTDGRPIKYLERNIEPNNWWATWTPDSQYGALKFTNSGEIAEVVNEQGQLLHRWKTTWLGGFDQIGWVDCKP